jgi:hypothetical protein
VGNDLIPEIQIEIEITKVESRGVISKVYCSILLVRM